MAIHDWTGSGMTGYQGNMYCLTNANARWLQQNGYLATNTLFPNDNNCPTVATLNSYASASSYGTSEYAGLGSSNLCPVGYIGSTPSVYTHKLYGSSGCGTDYSCACGAFSEPPAGYNPYEGGNNVYSYDTDGALTTGIHFYFTNTSGVLSNPMTDSPTGTIETIKWLNTTKVSLKIAGGAGANSTMVIC